MTSIPTTRIDKLEYYVSIAEIVSKRSTCLKKAVGCVIVADSGAVISTGYNGAPSKQPHCLDAGCILENDKCVRAVHAEENAIAQAAKHGIATDKASIYITHAPCFRCAKLLVNAGIKFVFYDLGIVDERTYELLNSDR